MRAAVWVAFLANLTAYPLTNGLLPYAAREIYGTNQTGLGYLSASFAVGSLVGSIALSLVGGVRIARLMIAATVIWYATLLVFAQMQTVPAAMACLLLAGFFQGLGMISLAVVLIRPPHAPFRRLVIRRPIIRLYTPPLSPISA